MSSTEETLDPWEYVSTALGITSQAWEQLGLGDDPAVAASSDVNVNVDRITSLLLIRIIAWLEPRGTFPDLAATTICRQLFVRRGEDKNEWPFPELSVPIILQLRQYVKVILTQYQENPYHNFEHCYHVTVSANKLLDLILNSNDANSSPRSLPYSYGFRDDSLMQFSQIFAALIHDVEHRGVPNRQLTIEDDNLALQYNDQSVAEMRSLTIAFSEFMKPDYGRLRNVLFPNIEDYRRFRAAVINLVLTTDLASPDRAQIGKSKWKEAFGDPYETVERKVIKQMERRASMASTGRRSIARPSRRMSAQSIMSELTLDSPVQMIETTAEELDDDESVSSTPDSSDNEGENGFTAPEPVVLDASKLRTANLQSSDGTGPVFRPPKQGTTPLRKLRKKKGVTVDAPPLVSAMNSVAGHSADESVHSTASGNMAGMALKFHRRLSSIGPGSVANSAKRHRNTRLGLLRTVDLTGEALETYQKMEPRMSATGSTGGMEFADGGAKRATSKPKPKEELDLLRESVVMETIMKAADVAHNLQSWEQMAKWSNRLFLELKRAYVQGRGDDPQGGWFSNQIGFLEAYLLPLARKLDDTGVFGDDDKGAIFATLVEENKERWMREGVSLTANIIREGHLQFPEADSDDEIEAYSAR
eukprot:Nitzschia sp. Nitz4//scaffold144_size56818//16930//18867//NITZ4_006531-RA/size56818-processed-gene-0.65-mRNA-1//1//CDS//3329536498//8560//frame0